MRHSAPALPRRASKGGGAASSHRVVTTIHVVTHEQVVCVRGLSADAEQLEQVVKLAVQVAHQSDWRPNRLHVGLRDENLPRLRRTAACKRLGGQSLAARARRTGTSGLRKRLPVFPLPRPARLGRAGSARARAGAAAGTLQSGNTRVAVPGTGGQRHDAEAATAGEAARAGWSTPRGRKRPAHPVRQLADVLLRKVLALHQLRHPLIELGGGGRGRQGSRHSAQPRRPVPRLLLWCSPCFRLL